MAKVAFITGASRGIGRATAEEFAKAGYQVAANFCSSGQAVEEFARQMAQQGCSVLPCQADVSDPQQVEQMVQTVLQQFGHIDVLVCNAGIARQGLLTDFTPEDWRRMMAVNLDGTFYCCRSVLPSMIRQHSGSIITTSSIWGLTGASCEVPYSAAKAGIIGLTKALAKEVGPSGIRVNAVAPGFIETDMTAAMPQAAKDAMMPTIPMQRLGAPEDVAKAVAFLASLLRNIFGLGSLLAFPGSMCGALLCGLVYWKTRNLPATLAGEVFGTGIIGGLLSYPVAVAFMGVVAGSIAFYAYVVPFLVSTVGGSILAGILVFTLQKSGALKSMRAALEH